MADDLFLLQEEANATIINKALVRNICGICKSKFRTFFRKMNVKPQVSLGVYRCFQNIAANVKHWRSSGVSIASAWCRCRLVYKYEANENL